MELDAGRSFSSERIKSSVNTTGQVTVSSDFNQKKLARQLDFTAFNGVSTSPERTQQKQQIESNPFSQTPLITPLRHESPQSRRRPPIDVKEGTPKKQRHCNCKNSRCLKLYCECFASGVYCDGCNCTSCYNNVGNEAARHDAIEATLDRNPNAFRPKIETSPHGTRENKEEALEAAVVARHNKGCHCKKSGCLKKYCECFQGNILCSENCKCVDCKNFEGSQERQARFHGDQSNALSIQKAAANDAINEAVGISGFGFPPAYKKRKDQEFFFGTTSKDPSATRLAQFPWVNNLKSSVPSSPSSHVSAARAGSSAVSGSSKFTYRSLLSGMIQQQDVKELCSLLVVLSKQAATMLAEKNDISESQTKREDHKDKSLHLATQDREREPEALKMQSDVCLSAHLADKIVMCDSDTGSNVSEAQTEIPMSPGTLALICDEHDTLFTGVQHPSGTSPSGQDTSVNLSWGQSGPEVYPEQEKLILSGFLNCIRRLVTCGIIKGKQCSLGTKTEGVTPPVSVGNGTEKAPTTAEVSHLESATGVNSTKNSPAKVGLPVENGHIEPKNGNRI